MAMVFCRGCGREIDESAAYCPHCGAQQAIVIEAGDGIPDGVRGWSWGAFCLNWIWAIGNQVWIGLLALVPGLGFIIAVILGIKGREWAWKNGRWESLDHFNRVQRRWSIWGLAIVLALILLGTLTLFAFPAYFLFWHGSSTPVGVSA